MTCREHGPFVATKLGSVPKSLDGPCPHCAADSEILEEKIERVVDAMFRPFPLSEDRREVLRDALRELVREVRR